MRWCKERALAYLDQGDIQNAFASMTSDLGKHPETQTAGEAMTAIGLLYLMNHDHEGMRRWITGFAE